MTAMAQLVTDAAPRPGQLVALALDRAYAAFTGHRIGSSMHVRRDDVTSDDVAALAVPVRTVTAEALDRWLPHAVTTWGTGDDLRALLPRVLELFASGQLCVAPEALFAKIRRAGAAGWSVEEQAAVDDVVTAVWLATLATWPARIGQVAWRLLVATVELGGELSAFLDDWLLMLGSGAPEQGPARRHLHELDRTVRRLEASGAGIAGLFWTPNPAEAERLATWLASPFTTAQLGDDPAPASPSAPAARSSASRASS